MDKRKVQSDLGEKAAKERKRVRVIGITGGMGAGKSEILVCLQRRYGASVIQADQVGHVVIEPGGMAYQAVLDAFGGVDKAEGLLRPDGSIDRGVLAGLVFGKPEELKRLNGIIHPAVKEWICREMEYRRQQGQELLVIEAALLIEAGYEKICQELWYIYARPEVRRERLKSSRGYSDARIDAVFASQLSEEEFRRHCQVVIDNSGAFSDTSRQIGEAVDRWQMCARP